MKAIPALSGPRYSTTTSIRRFLVGEEEEAHVPSWVFFSFGNKVRQPHLPRLDKEIEIGEKRRHVKRELSGTVQSIFVDMRPHTCP